jgi:hypothetical protein
VFSCFLFPFVVRLVPLVCNSFSFLTNDKLLTLFSKKKDSKDCRSDVSCVDGNHPFKLTAFSTLKLGSYSVVNFKMFR